MLNKCHLLLKWATQKTIFRHNSCIGIYMKYLQVESRKIKRWSIYWVMKSSIGNTWVPVKIIWILDYCKTKVCSIGVILSMGLLFFCADVINCWSLCTYLYKEWILRWGEMIYILQRVVLMKFMQNEPIPIRNTWEIHRNSKNANLIGFWTDWPK